MNFQRDLVFFDLETTGVDVNLDRIVEFAAKKVKYNNDMTILQFIINPQIHIPEGAFQVHGINDDKVKDKPCFSEVANQILDFIKDCDIVGYNSMRFDVPLLFNEFERNNIIWDYRQHNFIDVRNIFVINEPRTLEGAVKFYLNKDIKNAHQALGDVEATAEVFFEQLRKYNELPDSIDELAKYSNYGNDILDMGGKFKYNNDRDVVFTFGKYRDQLIKDNIDYLNWMLKSDFSNDTKRFIVKFLEEQN